MKKLLLSCASALLALGAFSAQAELPRVLWTCEIRAKVVDYQGLDAILKMEKVQAQGLATCFPSDHMQARTERVNITINTVGLDAGMTTGVRGMELVAVKAGLASPYDLYGEYSIKASVGSTLICGHRVSADASAGFSLFRDIDGGLSLGVEKRQGISLVDASVSTVQIEQ